MAGIVAKFLFALHLGLGPLYGFGVPGSILSGDNRTRTNETHGLAEGFELGFLQGTQFKTFPDVGLESVNHFRFFSGRPFSGVAAKSCSSWWLILSRPRLRFFSFSG
jgi:hypothetical protein